MFADSATVHANRTVTSVIGIVAVASLWSCSLGDAPLPKVLRYERAITRLGSFADVQVVVAQNSRDVAQVLERDGQECVFLSGKEISCHDDVTTVSLSSDGLHVAVAAADSDKSHVVVDGRSEAAHDSVTNILFSPDGSRLAYVAKDDGRSSVVIDGEQGSYYEKIAPTHFSSSSGSIRFYGGLDVLETGQFAYLALTGGQWRVVVDNKEWPVLDDVKKLAVQLGSRRMEFRDIEDMWLMGIGGGQATYHVPLVAAPQGSRVAIISAVGDKWTVVADGHAGALYDDIRALGEHSQPVFSPDGQHLAYVAKKAEKWIVVRDEKEGPEFDDIGRDLTFRPDGSSVAYAALDGDQWHAVIAGEKGPGYVDGISRPLLSFDGARSAYFAWQGDKIRAMVDGRTGPEFEAVGGLTFSDDSKHVAYRGRTSKGWHMVLDQNPGPAFESVQGTAVFAPSGDSVAYAASSGGQWHLVVDNEPVTPYAGGDLLSYSLGAFRFNVDGTSHAYNASRQEETGTSWIVKVDSAEPLEYNRAWEPVFSPGGAHVAWVASEGEQEFVVLDGARDPVYAEVLTRSPVFGSDGALEYLAWKDNDLYRVRHSPVY